LDARSSRRAALLRQIGRLGHRLEDLQRRSDVYSSLRLALAVVGTLVSILVGSAAGPGVFWVCLVAFAIVFTVLVHQHRLIRASIARQTGWVDIQRTHIARMDLDWSHIPWNLPGLPQPDHPFESDLDLTGERSIHHILDTAVAREGSERLRDWLLNVVPDLRTVQSRQALLRELIPLRVFREKLILNARLVAGQSSSQWESSSLLDWLRQHGAISSLRSVLGVSAVLAAVNIILLVLVSLEQAPRILLGMSFLIYAGVYILAQRRIGDLFAEALALSDPITRLEAVFHFLENYRYGRNDRLCTLCAPFLDRKNRPSAHLRRVGRIISAASIQRNPVLWLAFNAVLPWDIAVAHLLNRSKTAISNLLPIWLDVLHELEALGSLANFAYLNPGFAFPEVKEAPFTFQGEGLGHPLISHERRVCNDFSIRQPGELVIVTGSNMAGKSSFLRTLGVNLCLAYAGGVVCGHCFTVSLFRLFTCIRLSDSVADGFSYFYAEVRRLKALLDELETDSVLPLFFLIDEIFRGTNNRERLIGSRAYIHALVGRNGFGVIATHDLELVAGRRMTQVNMHFREEVSEGRMVFDYRLRPGPCPTTNALKIMQMEGLPIEIETVRN
jgi:ABC-type multidrug transport system fused ATPase/permease subunit